jgi:O-Antigen ligase
MSALVAVRARALAARSTPDGRERSAYLRLGTAWGLMLLNVIGYDGVIVHVPSAIGKAITQGALPLALLLLLSVNRRMVVRPNVFLCIVTLLPLEAIVTAMDPQFLGTVYRTVRLAEFVAALWLLSPWFGRRDMLLVRYQLTAYAVVLASVIVGVPLAPGTALGTGRLQGTIWVVPATQVAHYSAILLGSAVILWACGKLRGRLTLMIVAVTSVMLLLTHTRTALTGAIAGIVVAGLSLIERYVRVRKLFLGAIVVVSIAVVTVSSLITAWLTRGESSQELGDLTGRTKVWGPLLALPRDRFQEIFGFGLSNSSFNGLPIDSNWLSSYQEQGLLGAAICAVILLFLLIAASSQPTGPRRALALFLVTYCLVASFTEDGFTDATPYMLDLFVAASLLLPPLTGEVQGMRPIDDGLS